MQNTKVLSESNQSVPENFDSLSDEDFNHPQGVPIESTDNRPNAH